RPVVSQSSRYTPTRWALPSVRLTSMVKVLPYHTAARRLAEPGTLSARGSLPAGHPHTSAPVVVVVAYAGRTVGPPTRVYPSDPPPPCHDPWVVVSAPTNVAEPPAGGGGDTGGGGGGDAGGGGDTGGGDTGGGTVAPGPKKSPEATALTPPALVT